jgi:hypothetical protein
MKKRFLALMLLGCSAVFGQTDFRIGISIGEPRGYYAPAPPPPPRVVRIPRSPGRNYVWVPGYWQLRGRNYHWVDGYWTRPPRRGAQWVQPRYRNHEFRPGYWR